jgi:hypothetical protein
MSKYYKIKNVHIFKYEKKLTILIVNFLEFEKFKFFLIYISTNEIFIKIT